MPLYNINLDKGEAVEYIYVSYEGLPLAEVISNLVAAAEGLDNPTIDISSEDDYDLRYQELSVVGTRKMTSYEIQLEMARRKRETQWREHMKNFKPNE